MTRYDGKLFLRCSECGEPVAYIEYQQGYTHVTCLKCHDKAETEEVKEILSVPLNFQPSPMEEERIP